MAQTGPNSVIHRKTRSGRQDFDARAMTPSKALRLALARSADTLLDLALSVTTVEQTRITAATVARTLGEDGLLVLLDGERGARGAIKLDAPLIAALIEVQIIGEVRAGAPRPRRYTRTDAAMAAPFLDAVLRGFDDELRGGTEAHSPYALRFGDLVEDARVLALALEGAEYECFRVTLDLASGARTGAISVLLPRRAEPPATGAPPAQAAGAMEGALGRNALDAAATLDAVLARITMPLREICALEPGMTIPLSPEALTQTELHAPGRHVVAAVRLGQMNGQRAVRLVQASPSDAAGPPEPRQPALPGPEGAAPQPDPDAA